MPIRTLLILAALTAPAFAQTGGRNLQPPPSPVPPKPVVVATPAPETPKPKPRRRPTPPPDAAVAPGETLTPATPPATEIPAVEKPVPPPERTTTLPSGTPITIRTTSTLSTKTQVNGDAFAASLEQPLAKGNWIIAPAGTAVEGVVAEATKGGRVKGRAKLAIRLTALQLAGGLRLNLTTNTITVEAQGTKGEDAEKVGIGGGLGAAIGAIAGGGKGAAIGAAAGAGAGTAVVLLTRGDDANFPSESRLQFSLVTPLTVTDRR